ncbi:MAG: surface lipoprotein assembly modifier [Sphingomicrobium sp.]
MVRSLLSAIAAAILSAAVAPAIAEEVLTPSASLTAGQMLRLSDDLTRSGQSAKAEFVLEALTRDPDSDIRNEARFRESKLLAARGRLSAAAVILRQILDEKPNAVPVRLELAGILDRLGDKDGAWRQLRAAQATGLPPAVARLVDRYSEALRSQRSFGASFEIALAPDSNINRATRSDTLGTVFGNFDIGQDGKAKSGTGLSLQAQMFRRFPLNTHSSLLIRGTGAADLYRDSRFNDIAADVATGPELDLGHDRLQLELGFTQRWFGQKPFLRSVRTAATYSHPLGRRTLLRLNGNAALLDNQMNDLEDGKSYSGQLDIERALGPTGGIAANFGLDREALKDPGYATTGWRAALTGWRDIGRLTLTAGAELGRLHADQRLTLFPEKREDRYSRLSLGATFRQLQYGGFAPVARLSIERNRSTIAFYDYRRVRLEAGVDRAF